MSEAEALLLKGKEIEVNKKITKKYKKHANNGGCFRMNGWKTTLLIVLVYLTHSITKKFLVINLQYE